MPTLRHAIFATFSLIVPVIAKIQQRIQPFIDFKNHITTVTTISASRTALRDMFFATIGNKTISTIATLYVSTDLIDNHFLSSCASASLTRMTCLIPPRLWAAKQRAPEWFANDFLIVPGR